MKYTEQEKQEAREHLLKLLKPGDVVYTVLRSTARSGMSRRIDLFKIEDGEPFYLSGYAAILDSQPRPKNGMKAEGCGMDMGFSLVYNLGRQLWPDGFKFEGTGRNGDRSGWDNDGGYALRQRWL